MVTKTMDDLAVDGLKLGELLMDTEKVFSKLAAARTRDLGSEVDPYTAVVMGDEELESHLVFQCYYGFFKLYKGLKGQLSSLEWYIKNGFSSGDWCNFNLVAYRYYKDRIHSLQVTHTHCATTGASPLP